MNTFIHPSNHPDWLQPHSLDWYKHLGETQGSYQYPWNSTISKPNGESIFDEEVWNMVENKKVLDVGCGHGEMTIRCSSIAKEVIGFDVTDHFIDKVMKKDNVSFVVGDIKDGLPFDKAEFDCAYIRKGPTSAYPLLNRVVKKSGKIIGLHPGDDSGQELAEFFPDLFNLSSSKIIDKLKGRLEESGFSHSEIEIINSTEYLQAPEDVIKRCCFGQIQTVYEWVMKENISQVSKIFKQNALKEGLPITYQRYIVHASM